MKKRISAILLAALMVASLIPMSGLAAGGYIKINDTQYNTFEDAMDVNCYVGGSEAVTVEVYGSVTLSHGIAFTAKDITIKGMTSDAEIVLEDNADDNNYSNPYEATQRPTGFSVPDSANYAAEPGSVIKIQDLKLVNHKNLSRYGSGHSWRTAYYTYAGAENVTYTNVDFDGGVSVTDHVSFVDCTFTENRSQMYCVFIDQEYSSIGEDYSATFEGCEFNPGTGAYGGVKAANKDGSMTLEVEDCVFTSVPNKPAINADTNMVTTIKNTVFMDCDKGAYDCDSGTLNNAQYDEAKVEEAITTAGGKVYADVVDLTPAYAGPVMNWVKVNAADNGVVKSGPLAASAGATVTLYPKAAEGYVLDTVEVLDAEGNAVVLDGLKFAIPAGGVTVNATFKLAD